MPSKPLHAPNVLHLEDSPEDGELVKALLRSEWPDCAVRRVETREEFEQAIQSQEYDFILSDNTLPGFDGGSALENARRVCPKTPFIFLSGTLGEERAIEALQQGAADYVLKDRPARLVPAIRQAFHRKQVEAELHDHQEKFRQQAELLDQADDAILVRSLDDRVTYWNHGAERLYGWTAAEMQSPGAYGRLFRPGLTPREARTRVMESGAWTGELRMVTKAGRDLRVHSRWTLLRTPSGEPHAILSLSRDITEQKELETQLLRAQRLESIGMLAGGIAHDLNNVLTPILMSVNLLEQRTEDEEAKRLLAILESSAERGSDLVRQVLAFARGGEGERAELQAKAVIRDVARLLAETLPRTIEIETELAENLGTFLGNSTELSQVLMNLCVNARDAMPNGGMLTIRAENRTVDEAMARRNPGAIAGPHVEIAVTDTGCGMPPDLIERIFDPFFTTKPAGKGTGLGLSTALGIVRSHRGFLQVVSEPGRGTEFRLFFPAILQPTAPATRRGDASPLPRGNGETILVIEDEDGVRRVARSLLESRGYRVVDVPSGAAGIALYRERGGEIDAVLTDMMMPGLQGGQVIAALKAINPDVRIVVMSGVVPEKEALAEEPGRLAFVAKPMTARQLFQGVHQVLGSRARR